MSQPSQPDELEQRIERLEFRQLVLIIVVVAQIVLGWVFTAVRIAPRWVLGWSPTIVVLVAVLLIVGYIRSTRGDRSAS